MTADIEVDSRDLLRDSAIQYSKIYGSMGGHGVMAKTRLFFPAGRLHVACLSGLIWCAAAGWVHAQQLRFTLGRREAGPPDYATFRIGPAYSHFRFSQDAGVRYTDGTLGVVDFMEGAQRGAYLTNGIDFPLITDISLFNYLQITKQMDVDFSFWCRYEYYPLKTQDDIFLMVFSDPELLAEFSTSLLWEFRPVSYLTFKIKDQPSYLLNYVDQRGREDQYGGMRFSRFRNDAEVSAGILLSRDMDVALSLNRLDVLAVSKAFANQEQTGYKESAVYEYQLTRTFVLGLRADYMSADYAVTERGDYASQSYAAFANAELSASSKAAAEVGYGEGKTGATNGVSGMTEAKGIVGLLSFDAEIWRGLVFQSSYSRSIRPGFDYGVESMDQIKGRLKWDDGFSTVTLWSEIDNIDVSGSGGIGYRDWLSALEVSHQLTANCLLGLSSSYSVRDSSPAPGMTTTAGLPAELVHGYSTWVNTVQASLELMKGLSLGAYVQYTIRDSAEKLLAYDRLNAGLNLTYIYEY